MTNPNRERIEITPEIIELFAHYYWDHPAWGSLHIVLDDDNVEDGHVEFCWGHALAAGDMEGWALAGILTAMTKSQRSRIGRRAEEWLNHHWRLMLNMARMTGAHAMFKANLVANANITWRT